MKISALRLYNVKRFAGRGVAIEGIADGVNVLCAANEFGKSTSFEALHALFFQPHTGTPGDVQRLQPYSKGSPLIEADISTAEGRFRITKQFYAGRSARVVDLATGRLVAQAGEAENFIGGLVRGGTAGPAGLLWVRQGVTGLEKRPPAVEDSERKVRASLLESVQGEVEAVTGGRRMAEIVAVTQAALSELVTATGRPKAGSRYAAAIDERARLAAEETRLSREVAALQEALDRRAATVRQLAELESPEYRQRRREAVEAAQALLDRARTHAESLKTAEAELRLAGEHRNAAEQELTAFRKALGRAKELRDALATAEQHRRQAVQGRADASAAIGTAEADADLAEAQEQEARDLLARLDAALKARDAAERRAVLGVRLREAEAVRDTVEKIEARLAVIKVPQGAVEELQTLEIDIATARATRDAARASVAISYEAGAPAIVTMDGRPLNAGEERGYDGRALLAMPGIGTVTLRSNRPASGDKRLEEAEVKHRRLLDAMGVATLAAARERDILAQRTEGDLKIERARLALLAPEGLNRLREQAEALAPDGDGRAEVDGDPALLSRNLAAAEERRKSARIALRQFAPLRTRAEAAFVAAETTLATLRTESAQVEAALGPTDGRRDREVTLAQRFALLDGDLVAARARVDGLRAAGLDLATADASLQRVRSVESGAEKEIQQLREGLAELNAEIRTRSDEAVEESWRETADKLSMLEERVRGFEREVATLQRLSEALAAARSRARELYLKPVMSELRPLLGLLFDDITITFDERTLLPHMILRNGQEEDVDRLSGGMKEQLSILTRLAFARLLARDGRPAPVILDDALVFSDDDRIEKMFDALHRQSSDQQIIVFSCRQRAFRQLGGNVLQLTDWSP